VNQKQTRGHSELVGSQIPHSSALMHFVVVEEMKEHCLLFRHWSKQHEVLQVEEQREKHRVAHEMTWWSRE
jgi:hypothetical protein